MSYKVLTKGKDPERKNEQVPTSPHSHKRTQEKNFQFAMENFWERGGKKGLKQNDRRL